MRQASRVRTALVIMAVVGTVFGVWVLWLHLWYQSVQPQGSTLAEVLSELSEPHEQRVFAQNGREYLAIFGSAQALPKFPSGPPVYVFDDTGRLVGWTPDIGDDEALRSRWIAVYRGRAITSAELREWPNGSR